MLKGNEMPWIMAKSPLDSQAGDDLIVGDEQKSSFEIRKREKKQKKKRSVQHVY